MSRKPPKISVTGNCHIDSSANDLFWPVQYQTSAGVWEVFHNAESLADAIADLGKRAGFKDHSELVQYINDVISSPRPKAPPTKRKRRSVALYDEFLAY